jgi:flagellar protein FliL
MAEESPQEETPAAAKAGKGKLFLIVALVAVLVLGGGAAWFLGLIPHGHKGGESAEAKDEPVLEGKDRLGAVQGLDPFIANLADDDGKRYLRTTLQVEFFEPKTPEDFNRHQPQIRDLLLTLFTSKAFSEIRTPQGKALLREEIINRMNRVFHRDIVKAVYFTEFIVQ